MALTATISLSPSTVTINKPVGAVLVISNSGGSAVNLLSIQPLATFTGLPDGDQVACGLGVPVLSAGQVTSVPASGSLSFPFGVVFFAPSTGPIGAGSGTYSVGALIYAADGSIFSPTPATVTVNPIPLPSSEL